MERKGNLWGNVRIKQMSDRNRFRLILHSLDWNLGSLDNVISAIDCTSVHLTLNYCCRFGRWFRSQNKYEMPLVNFCYHHLIYRDTQLGRVGLFGVNSLSQVALGYITCRRGLFQYHPDKKLLSQTDQRSVINIDVSSYLDKILENVFCIA